MEYKKKNSDEYLVKVWEHTCSTAIAKYPVEKTISVGGSSWKDLTEKQDADKSEISVVDGDCVSVAKEHVQNGSKVCMLNMASKWKPGGGVSKGKMAQEEHLCRTSNLYFYLHGEKYPLDDATCLLSPNVTFFKDPDYSKSKKAWQCDVVSIAAYPLAKPSDFSEKKYDGTVDKIKLMLCAAYESKCDVLILSAFGCGAYKNPNHEIAKAFHQVLVQEGWGKKFSKIVFAIIDDKNSDGNLKAFRDVFDNKTS